MLNGSGCFKTSPGEDMAAYDQLPHRLRYALASSATKVFAVGALMQFRMQSRRYGRDGAVELTLDTIRRVDATN